MTTSQSTIFSAPIAASQIVYEKSSSEPESMLSYPQIKAPFDLRLGMYLISS